MALERFWWVIKKLKANGLRQYQPELKNVIRDYQFWHESVRASVRVQIGFR